MITYKKDITMMRKMLMFFLPLVFVLTVSAISVQAIEIEQSHSDKREMAYFKLPNQLRVLVISDSRAEKAAASLDVNVGSGDDSDDRYGLAHFLEHMLFLGTKKYVTPGEFQDFIAGHGGSHNAYTSAMHTNYFFDIEPAHFEPAFDRFAQFFIEPLFIEKYVERERKAVHSEYKSGLVSEYRRERDVLRELVHPEHSVHNFSVGNLDTLKVDKPRPLREDLLGFYQKHYSANQMTLVVSSHHSVEQLKSWVIEKFTAVGNRNVVKADIKAPLFAEGFLPARVDIVPNKELRELSFGFPIPSTKPYWDKKPTQYIGHFIGHEGEGSLLSVLKEANWARGLRAGDSLQWRGGEAFWVTISLTEEGMDNVDAVKNLLFEYINLLLKEGVESWRYAELAKVGEFGFKYGEQADSIREVMNLASALHDVPAKNVLSSPYIYGDFDEALVRRYLSYLTPSNMLMIVKSPELKTDKESHFYKTAYKTYSLNSEAKVSEGSTKEDAERARKMQKTLASDLALPRSNPYIAADFSIIEEVSEQAWQAKPITAFTHKHSQGWFLNDNVYALPKGRVQARYKLPSVADSVNGAISALVFEGVIREHFNESNYEASIAGLSFSVTATSRGLDMDFHGYNDKLELYAKDTLRAIRKYQTKRREAKKLNSLYFNKVKKDLIRRYSNKHFDRVYSQLFYSQLPSVIYSPYWEPKAVIDALERFSLEDYQQELSHMFDGAQGDYFVFGNIAQGDAKKYFKNFAKLIGRKKADLASGRVLNLSETKHTYVKHHTVPGDDNAVLVYIQGRNDTIAERAQMVLLKQMLSTPFYNSLRTEQQLGYIVFSTNFQMRKMPGVIALVQSPTYSSSEIYTRIDAFFGEQQSVVFENFERNKQAVISALEERPQNQSELAKKHWGAILQGDDQFDLEERMIAALKAVTKEQMTQMYEGLVMTGKNRLILVGSKQTDEAKVFGETARNLGVLETFKAEMKQYVYP
ncbi:MAG: peptidase M16 [Alteromonadaceae bacterium]|nr:MAG: peptidase M16 [Alteromonadaceae bacterium]